MRHLNSILVVIFFLISITGNADMIVFVNGNEYEGKLIKADTDSVTFKINDEIKTYSKSEVVHIRLQKDREWDIYSKADQVADPYFKTAFNNPPSPQQAQGASAYIHLSKVNIALTDRQTWSEETRSIIRILKEDGEKATIRDYNYRPENETFNILHGTSAKTDGTLIHLRDTAVQNISPYASTPLYDKIKTRHLALPEGKPGTLLDTHVKKVRHTAFQDHFYSDEILFGGSIPADTIEYSIFVPKNISINWELLNNDNTVKYTKTTTPEGTTHKWSRKNINMLIPEPMQPPFADLIPRLVISTCPYTWQELADNYNKKIQKLNMKQIVSCPETELNKIWDFVSKKITGLSISTLATGIYPGNLSETWSNRQGSEIDKLHLLYYWLKINKYDVSWHWVRLRGEGAPGTKVPSLDFFQTPVLKVNNRYISIGDELSHLGEPVAELSGAYGLPGQSDLKIASSENFKTVRNIALQINADGSAMVQERHKYYHNSARSLRTWLSLTKTEKDNNIQAIVKSVAPYTTGLNYSLSGGSADNKTMTLDINYTINNFADIRKNLLCIQLPWLKYYAYQVGRSRRMYPLFWSSPTLTETATTVTSPKGFKLANNPQPVNIKTKYVNLSANLDNNNKTITYNLKYERNSLEAPTAFYNDLKNLLETRSSIGQNYWLWEKE